MDGLPPSTSPRLHTSDSTSSPIIAVAVIGILATAFLLVGYYVFVIKCCLNWHLFSMSRRRNQDDLLMAYSPGRTSAVRGLDESVIRSIPIFKFKKKEKFEERSFLECAVCLNEFQEEERLKMIPNCSHVFHIDCIDVWLQNNDNCPLCRTSVSGSSPFRLFPFDHVMAPSSSPQDPTGIDEDQGYVVIELGDYTDRTRRGIGPSSPRRKIEQSSRHKNGRISGLNKAGSMGDECIDIRGKDTEFAVQTIRRSFSMDSLAHRQMILAVQEIVQQRRQRIEVATVEGTSSCTGGSRSMRNFFSFGRGSRSSVLPVYFEPS